MSRHPPTKRYFITDQLENIFPQDFHNSSNQRHVTVINCKVFQCVNDVDVEAFYVPKFITLHADFIHDARHHDSFVMFANQESVYPKKYEQLGPQQKFKMWFKNMDGSSVDMTKIKFIVEILLTY